MLLLCIISGQFPLEDLLWYKEKKTLGESYREQCLKYSTFVQSLIDETYTDTSLADNIDTMRDIIIANNYMEASVVSGAIWFDNMTSYIEILRMVQDRLGKRIIHVSISKTYNVSCYKIKYVHLVSKLPSMNQIFLVPMQNLLHIFVDIKFVYVNRISQLYVTFTAKYIY